MIAIAVFWKADLSLHDYGYTTTAVQQEVMMAKVDTMNNYAVSRDRMLEKMQKHDGLLKGD